MKVLDEKGKLFGKINLIDLIVIVVLVLILAAVGWKLAGQPFGLGAAVPGTVACGIALVVVSLATYKRAPSVFLKAEKQS